MFNILLYPIHVLLWNDYEDVDAVRTLPVIKKGDKPGSVPLGCSHVLAGESIPPLAMLMVLLTAEMRSAPVILSEQQVWFIVLDEDMS